MKSNPNCLVTKTALLEKTTTLVSELRKIGSWPAKKKKKKNNSKPREPKAKPKERANGGERNLSFLSPSALLTIRILSRSVSSSGFRCSSLSFYYRLPSKYVLWWNFTNMFYGVISQLKKKSRKCLLTLLCLLSSHLFHNFLHH